MKHALKAMILAGMMGAASLATATPADAQRYRSGVSVYVTTGNAHRGHYDRWGRWHPYRGYGYRAQRYAYRPRGYYGYDRRCEDWRFRRYHRSYCRRW